MPTLTSGQTRNAGAIENALQAEKKAVPLGVKAAAEPIQAFIEARVSEPYPPASEPLNPAHMRTGKYRRGWEVKARHVTLTITNKVKYAGFLEFGTKFMVARPATTRNKNGGGAAARNLIRKAGRSAGDTTRRAPLPRSTT